MLPSKPAFVLQSQASPVPIPSVALPPRCKRRACPGVVGLVPRKSRMSTNAASHGLSLPNTARRKARPLRAEVSRSPRQCLATPPLLSLPTLHKHAQLLQQTRSHVSDRAEAPATRPQTRLWTSAEPSASVSLSTRTLSRVLCVSSRSPLALTLSLTRDNQQILTIKKKKKHNRNSAKKEKT